MQKMLEYNLKQQLQIIKLLSRKKYSINTIIPQLQQMAPETAGLAFEFQHRFPTASIRNQDDCDTSLLHSQVCQPAESQHNAVQATCKAQYVAVSNQLFGNLY